ncbi:MAG: PRC-barrel domain-containing protein [Syntrophaceae bacterium]|nr:PRC-barrel domain-containing protein [Syntrophaceae bacterium]
MNKKVKILMVISIFGLALFGSSKVFAKEWIKGEAGAMSQPTAWETFEASWFIGHRVYSPLGVELGQIDDLMIDRTDGHISLVILSGVQGFGAEFAAAPFGALERMGENTFQLNFGDQYTSIPSTPYEDPYAYLLYRDRSIVGLSTIPATIDPLWADSLYSFYGQRPYWTEGRTVPPDIVSYRTARPSILESLLMGKTAPVLMGARVQSKDGGVSARIDDLIIDSKGGRVAFLVLDKVPRRGDSQVAVPFGELSVSGNTFILNTTGDRLSSAPNFNEYTDMNNLKWARNAYSFFGQRPYWKE